VAILVIFESGHSRIHADTSPQDESRYYLAMDNDTAGSPHGYPASAAPRRFLGLFAHPDDETFCAGGTFAKYAAQGAEIMVVCATRGQAGQIRDAGIATRRTIGQVREQELRAACDRLGIHHARCLDFVDGALTRDDPAPLIGEFTRAIRAFRPTTVFTFGPDGGYGHPDHVAISNAATDAFDLAGDATRFPEHVAAGLAPYAPATLYYAHFPRHRRRLLDRMVLWLVGHDERFRGDIGFVKTLLHIAEEARDLGSIADYLETRWFPAETFVIEQGEAPSTLYLILSGDAEAVRELADGSTQVLGRLGPGEFFGEIGIAMRKPRNAHVIARTNLTCLLFSPAPPRRFLGRGEGAHLTGPTVGLEPDEEDPGQATTCIDVSSVIEQKIAAIAAYRSQFAFQPDLLPPSLLDDLFGTEYFIRARPRRVLETDIV
jgi:LmbE family N-acetylglucosaminyl deacetylase